MLAIAARVRSGPLDYLGHAPGSIFRSDSLNLGMRGEEAFTLGQRHRMGFDTLEFLERCASTTNQMVSNRDDHFGDNVQRAFQ